MRVLVSDNLGDAGVDLFRKESGIDVDVNTGLSPEDLIAVIADYHALVIRSATRVTEDVLKAGVNLKVVGRAGIGLDNVDIPTATKRGVAVMNTPGGNVVTTAEHAIAMMMALTRNIPQGTAALKEGRWEKKKLQGRELFNKTLGVIGYGKIGSIVADRARGLKMRVVVHDPLVNPERIEKDGHEAVSLHSLYRSSDYITVHVPKMKETGGLLNKAAFDDMKDGVMVVNCARGGIINESDLLEAIDSGKVAGAALDVFETEPPGKTALVAHEKVICTPHLGASTIEAQTNVAVAIAEQIVAFLKHNTIINAVNVPSVTGELLARLQPFLSLGDAIGALQAQLITGAVKEIAIEYAGEYQGLDLAPVTTAIVKGFLARRIQDEVNSVNAPVIARDMGIRVTETTGVDSGTYTQLMTAAVVTTDTSHTITGTVFGKNEPRVVRINDFRLELIPEKGNFALIHNLDKPGAIGGIGTALGEYGINIARMTVGQEGDGARNVIFIQVDAPLTGDVIQALQSLPLVKTVTPFEL